MTHQSDFKARVRARMAKTGERYATARAVLLAQARGADAPGASAGPDAAGSATATAVLDRPGIPLLPGYDRVGGQHTESAALANLLAQAGLRSPHTNEPFTEALAFGLAGGIGFMSFAFEYANHPPMLTVTLRSDSYPDAFVRRGLERSGATVTWQSTGSSRVARGHLDDALAAGRPALVVVDLAGLPWYGTDPAMRGFGPLYVVVAGRDGERFAIDDRAPVAVAIEAGTLAGARAGYAKGKHALATVAPADRTADAETLAAAVLEAVRGTVRGFHEPPYRGYVSNFGLRGLETWARRITDPKDGKGWPTLLPDDRAFATALVRMVEGIELEFTAPAGGRPLYAEFLDEAAELTARPRLHEAADAYRRAAAAWRAFVAAALPDDEPSLAALRDVLERRLQAIDELGEDAAGPNAAARADRERLLAGVRLERPRAQVLERLGSLARDVVAAERAALEVLEGAGA